MQVVKMPGKNKIPDRWLDYSKMGNIVEGSRFIPMKVPLRNEITSSLPSSNHFNPTDALLLAKKKGINIGLVIDLSFTRRYYDSSEFSSQNVEHCKIFMPGRELPSNKILREFFDIVRRFENENKTDAVAVHCTHGLNRTGYMICKYLIEEKKMLPKDAISAFNEARGHKIEREVYLNDLSDLKVAKPMQYPAKFYRGNNKKRLPCMSFSGHIPPDPNGYGTYSNCASFNYSSSHQQTQFSGPLRGRYKAEDGWEYETGYRSTTNQRYTPYSWTSRRPRSFYGSSSQNSYASDYGFASNSSYNTSYWD